MWVKWILAAIGALVLLFGTGACSQVQSPEDGTLDIGVHDLRSWAKDKHRQVDDYPFGGGRGMILKIEPLFSAYDDLKRDDTTTVLMSAGGTMLTATRAKRFSRLSHMLVFCGRYEGVDERFMEYVDMEISIGKYVLYGGEVPAMAMIESITRFNPEILDREVVQKETYSSGKYRDYPQYTRPRNFNGKTVPEVLMSGNHKKIESWRERNRKKI